MLNTSTFTPQILAIVKCSNSWTKIKNASIKTATMNIMLHSLHDASLKCG
ncbi:hypothetical protein [Helicobacter pylori]